MFPSRLLPQLASGLLLLGATGPSLRAEQLLLQQLNPNAPALTSTNTQRFEFGRRGGNTMVVDDFTLTGTAQLTHIQTAFICSPNSAAFAAITAWQVSIFSSAAAAAAVDYQMLGDVATVMVPAGSVLSSNFGAFSAQYASFDIPLDLSLAAGHYYVATIPVLSFIPGGFQTYQVYANTGGGGNGIYSNPGGEVGFAPTSILGDAAFNIYGNVSAVPEPATWLAGGLAVLAALTGVRRRRR